MATTITAAGTAVSRDRPTIRRILATRGRLRRATMATLLLSHGVPMMLGGDEIGRTQNGNNNAYCQDNEINWIDWSDKRDTRPSEFVRGLIAIRLADRCCGPPSSDTARRSARPACGTSSWYSADGTEMSGEDWQNDDDRRLMLLFNGVGQRSLLYHVKSGVRAG